MGEGQVRVVSSEPAVDAVAAALRRLAAGPGVPEAVEAARLACAELRWHPALRRRAEEARAEAQVRAACSIAGLAGARIPLDAVRDAARGAGELPADGTGRTVRGALRAVSEVERLSGSLRTAPLQALARLHMAAAAGLVEDVQLGRPRGAGEQPLDGQDLLDAAGRPLPAPDGDQLGDRIQGLVDLLRAPDDVPALVVGALAVAEVRVARPFVAGNPVVACALGRAVLVGRGLDTTGVAVWEAAMLDAGPRCPAALAGYASGTPDGVTAWITFFAGLVQAGADRGRAVCDAVLAGRLPS